MFFINLIKIKNDYYVKTRKTDFSKFHLLNILREIIGIS